MKPIVLSIVLFCAILWTVTACKSDSHDQHTLKHSQHMSQINKARVPHEAGQDGFAAIAEVVKLLSDNPDTDWSKVNINALREHLLDMDHLVTGAVANEQPIENGLRFHVTGQGKVFSAIQRMVPAHTVELNKMLEFTATTETIANGIALIITGKDDKAIAKIKGLGFFGLMATGSHHQAHHYMMATGKGHKMHH